jgi:hypothetical protein
VAGTSALKREGGPGGGDVAWARRTLCARMERWKGGGGGDEVAGLPRWW